MRIALDRVPREVEAQEQIRGELRKDQPRRALVDLEHGDVHARASAPIDGRNKTRRNAGREVGTEPVAHHPLSLREQGTGEKIRRGGLPVRSGHHDHAGRVRDRTDDSRMDAPRDPTRNVGSRSTHDAEHRRRELRRPDREQEPHGTAYSR